MRERRRFARILSSSPSQQVSEGLMYVGVADAACMHFHEHLLGSGLRLRNIFDLPRTARPQLA
jgi:hypothetical protein